MKHNFNLLNRFVERKCVVSFHSLLENGLIFATYVYESFYYEIDSDCICLEDYTEEESNTSIELSKVIAVTNLTSDIYRDVVSFKTDNYMIDVCLLEDEVKLPMCHKCDKEIKVPVETIWNIYGNVNYGSRYDDYEENKTVNSLVFCDDCIYDFVGYVGDIGGYDE